MKYRGHFLIEGDNLNEEEIRNLINPNKGRRDSLKISKIFGSFIAGKEEKNE